WAAPRGLLRRRGLLAPPGRPGRGSARTEGGPASPLRRACSIHEIGEVLSAQVLLQGAASRLEGDPLGGGLAAHVAHDHGLLCHLSLLSAHGTETAAYPSDPGCRGHGVSVGQV